MLRGHRVRRVNVIEKRRRKKRSKVDGDEDETQQSPGLAWG